MRLFFLCLILFVLASCENEPRYGDNPAINSFYSTDDLGRSVNFPPQISRVISLEQGITDILYAAGAGRYIVGIPENEKFGMFPDSVAKIKLSEIDFAQFKALKPDLIVGSSTTFSKAKADSLTKNGFPTMLFSFKEWQDVVRVINQMGYIFGTESRARTAQDTLNAQWHALQNIMISSGTRPSILLATGSGKLVGFGKDSYVSQLLEDAGGWSITRDLSGGLQPIAPQLIARANPDYVFITPDVARSLGELIRKHPYLTSTNAYRLRKMYLIAPELVLHASPRYVDGAKEIAAALFTSAGNRLK